MPPTNRRKAPGSYRDAQLRARDRAGSLSQDALRNVQKAVQNYADELAARVRELPRNADLRRLLVESERVTRLASDTLLGRLTTATGRLRETTFSEVHSIWQDAGIEAATALGVPEAMLGAVRTPNLTMLGAYENLGPVNYKTLLKGHVANAQADVQHIIRQAITEGVSHTELAKRLRPYVAGAEEFHKAFGGIDSVDWRRLRSTTPEQRDAARKLKYNAERIAYSEIHNARAEAEVQHFAADPLVEAVIWRLSPFRGALGGPDVCDGLAGGDFFGLGPGIYPVDAVPLPPHPFDRCERVPKVRDFTQVSLPKPTSEDYKPKARWRLKEFAGKTITKQQADRLEQQTLAVLRATLGHPANAAAKTLMRDVSDVASNVLPTTTPSHVRNVPSLANVNKVSNFGSLWQRNLEEAGLQAGLSASSYRNKADAKARELVATAKLWRRDSVDAFEKILTESRWRGQIEVAGANNSYSKARIKIESVAFNVPENLAPEQRPIYGYLAHDVNGSSSADQYGSIAIRFKDNVRQRTTAQEGDSLTILKGGELRGDVLPQQLSQIDARSFTHDKSILTATTIEDVVGRDSYFETQMHGGVTLDDVEEVVFRNKVDADRLAPLLKQRGIAWRMYNDVPATTAPISKPAGLPPITTPKAKTAREAMRLLIEAGYADDEITPVVQGMFPNVKVKSQDVRWQRVKVMNLPALPTRVAGATPAPVVVPPPAPKPTHVPTPPTPKFVPPAPAPPPPSPTHISQPLRAKTAREAIRLMIEQGYADDEILPVVQKLFANVKVSGPDVRWQRVKVMKLPPLPTRPVGLPITPPKSSAPAPSPAPMVVPPAPKIKPLALPVGVNLPTFPTNVDARTIKVPQHLIDEAVSKNNSYPVLNYLVQQGATDYDELKEAYNKLVGNAFVVRLSDFDIGLALSIERNRRERVIRQLKAKHLPDPRRMQDYRDNEVLINALREAHDRAGFEAELREQFKHGEAMAVSRYKLASKKADSESVNGMMVPDGVYFDAAGKTAYDHDGNLLLKNEIHLSTARTKQLDGFLAGKRDRTDRTFGGPKTMIHETLHALSPMSADVNSYGQETTRFWEEALVELNSQEITARIYGFRDRDEAAVFHSYGYSYREEVRAAKRIRDTLGWKVLDDMWLAPKGNGEARLKVVYDIVTSAAHLNKAPSWVRTEYADLLQNMTLQQFHYILSYDQGSYHLLEPDRMNLDAFERLLAGAPKGKGKIVKMRDVT